MMLVFKMMSALALVGLLVGCYLRIQGLVLVLPVLAGGLTVAIARHHHIGWSLAFAALAGVLAAQLGFALGSILRPR